MFFKVNSYLNCNIGFNFEFYLRYFLRFIAPSVWCAVVCVWRGFDRIHMFRDCVGGEGWVVIVLKALPVG
jgi:hypothetical protein